MTTTNKENNHYKKCLGIISEILEKCGEDTYIFRSPNSVYSKIKILIDLQHYGGKTTIIDFTYNRYIALFFACHGDPKDDQEDGEIIFIENHEDYQ